jgi:hypothetical protein
MVVFGSECVKENELSCFFELSETIMYFCYKFLEPSRCSVLRMDSALLNGFVSSDSS